MANITGKRILSGSKGILFLDGELLGEVKSVESKATINRESVLMAGTYDEDAKVMSVSCEGSFILNKVYSTEKRFIESLQKGVDLRFQLFVTLDDPDAFGRESVQIDNCWFNELTITQFEVGALLEREFPFGHKFSDVRYSESIEKQA